MGTRSTDLRPLGHLVCLPSVVLLFALLCYSLHCLVPHLLRQPSTTSHQSNRVESLGLIIVKLVSRCFILPSNPMEAIYPATPPEVTLEVPRFVISKAFARVLRMKVEST